MKKPPRDITARIRTHCTYPACLEACPRKAIYKREEDGIVVIDQNRCQGYRYCIKACPYKNIYFNEVTGTSEKCIFWRMTLVLFRRRALGEQDEAEGKVWSARSKNP